MKRFLARVLPHLTIVFGVMTLVFYVVDGFNAVMAFMSSELSKQVFMVLAVLSIITSIMLISRQWKEDDKKARKAARRRELEEKIDSAEPEDPFETSDFFLPTDRDNKD